MHFVVKMKLINIDMPKSTCPIIHCFVFLFFFQTDLSKYNNIVVFGTDPLVSKMHEER